MLFWLQFLEVQPFFGFPSEECSVSHALAQMKDYRTDRAFREKMQGYAELWITGKREILQVA